jgi:hypothetical protein
MSDVAIIGRVVRRNMTLNDGTPRREKGYRAFVERRVPRKRFEWAIEGPMTQFCESPLFQTEAEALIWMPA